MHAAIIIANGSRSLRTTTRCMRCCYASSHPFLQLASVSDRIALLFLGLDVRHMTQTAPPSCNSSALYAAAHSQNNTRVFALRSMWLSGCLRVPAGSTTQLPFYTPGRG